MSIETARGWAGALAVAGILALLASGQATSGELTVKAVAEVLVRPGEDGAESVHLTPATRVVPGDEVIYTLEARNAGPAAERSPRVTYPVPAHMQYVADTATGPGAEVVFSVDGGATFATPEALRVKGDNARWRPATAGDYTHIRWVLKNALKSKSVAFMRFRAVVR